MDLRETCAGLQCADCECAVGERGRKTCSKPGGEKKQYGEWVVVVFRFGGKCSRMKTKGEKNSDKRG